MELVWNDSSSILSGISNPYPWASRTLISCEMPDSISGNIDESYHLGIQQQPDAICNQLIQSSFIAHQDPLHQTKQMTGQLVIPSSMDKTAADSPLISSRSATDWSYASPTEIPDSSTAATDMFISRHEMNQNYCGSFDQAGSSSRNDLMQMCYTYDANLNQLITLQSSIESLDCVLSSDNGGISATSTTEDNMKAIVLSAQNPPQKSTSSLVTYSVQRHGNGTEKYQSNSHSQGSTMKSQAMNCKPKSKPKPKSKGKGKGKTDEANPQLGMHYNYSSSTSSSSCLVFGQADPAGVEPDAEAIASVREMIYRAAAFRPVNLGTEVLDKPMMKRKNIKISSVPQTVAARERRERISDKIKILQKLVPGATKMDTASMLEEAANYLKFLKTQVKVLQSMGTGSYKDSINSMTSLCFSNSNSLNSFSFNTGLNSQNLSEWYAVNKTP